MPFRVVYGETMPAWERTFSTKLKAKAFAKKQQSIGDTIYNLAKTGTPKDNKRGLLSADRIT